MTVLSLSISVLFISFYELFSFRHIEIQPRDLLVPSLYPRFLLSPFAHDSIFHLCLTIVFWIWVSGRLEERLGTPSFARLLLLTWVLTPLAFCFGCGLVYLITAFPSMYKIASYGGGPICFCLATFESCLATDKKRERFALPFVAIVAFCLMPGESFAANVTAALLGLVLAFNAESLLPGQATALAPIERSYFVLLLTGRNGLFLSHFSSKEQQPLVLERRESLSRFV